VLLTVSRTITGPQRPEDAPTEIEAYSEDREDPTDISGAGPSPMSRTQYTPTGQLAVREKWGPVYIATAVVSRYKKASWLPHDPATRTWLLLLVLFGVAVTTAAIVAMI
jgi:hypothetical protein